MCFPLRAFALSFSLMRITILVPFLFLTGGIKAMLHYAEALHARGHTVTVVAPRYSVASSVPLSMRMQMELRERLRTVRNRSPINWFDLRVPLQRISRLDAAQLPAADVTLAADWTMASILTPARHLGRRVELIQGDESWNPEPARVYGGWCTPERRIAVSSRLVAYVAEMTGQAVVGPLIYGVDLHLFQGEPRSVGSPPRVGVLYHEAVHKGVADALEAVARVRSRGYGLELVMYGTRPRPRELPSDVEYHRWPLGTKLRDLYRSLDIWLCPSHTEGGPMPPMEAMACGVACVSTDVGAVRDYARDGESVLLSPPGDPEALAVNLQRLLMDESLRLRLAAAGHAAMQQRSWGAAAAELERFLVDEL